MEGGKKRDCSSAHKIRPGTKGKEQGKRQMRYCAKRGMCKKIKREIWTSSDGDSSFLPLF